MRSILIILLLTIMLGFPIFIFSEFLENSTAVKPMSVLYQIEIVELNEEQLSSLGLLDLKFVSSADKKWGIAYINESKELLLKFSYSQIIMDAEKSSKKKSKSSRFWLVANFNKEAHLSANQELIDPESGEKNIVGIDFAVKPLQINENSEAVLTDFNVISFPNSNLLNTIVWIKTNEYIPLTVVSLKSGYNNSASWYLEKKDEMRYFAIYAKCSIIKELPQEDIYLIGSIDGFSKMFWQIPEYPRENYMKFYLGSNATNYIPYFEVSLWSKNDVKFEIQSQLSKFPNFLVEVELRPFKEDFRLGGRAIYNQLTKDFIFALGMSDYIYHKLFVLSAGYYPIALDLISFSFEKAMWWFSISTDIDGSKLRIDLNSENDILTLNSEVDLKISKRFYLLGKINYNLNNSKFLMSMGIRLDF